MDDAEQHIGTRPATDTVDITMTGDLDRDQVTTAVDRPHSDTGDWEYEHRIEVYQAQGMVMGQLNGNIAEAMTRMRSHAYAHDRRLDEVAADIVARRLRFDADQP